MSKNREYSELPIDDDEFLIKYHSSRNCRQLSATRLFSSNNLVILLLFAFINPSLTNSTSLKHEAYFDTNSQIYHLAQDQYKMSINHNFQKLNGTSYYCFKEGTNWNQSIIESKCICKSGYSLQDCGMEETIKNQLLKKSLNCHFKQDTVNIRRLNKPSKIIFTMPLYECAKKECSKLIDELIKKYEYIVDLFIFVQIRNSRQEQQDKNLIYKNSNLTVLNSDVDEKVYLYSLSGNHDGGNKNHNSLVVDKQDSIKDLSTDQKQLSKVMKVNAFNDEQKNPLNNQKIIYDDKKKIDGNQTKKSNVIYQIKTLDLDSIKDSKEIVAKVYGALWNLVFNNVTNYRPTDKIIFVPPFAKVNEKFLNFFKFYYGFGEPVVLVDNFFTRAALYRTRLPKDIQEDLNQMNSAVMMSFQYAMSICKFKFDNFSQNYCMNNQNLISHFEKDYWKVCLSSANALDS